MDATKAFVNLIVWSSTITPLGSVEKKSIPTAVNASFFVKALNSWVEAAPHAFLILIGLWERLPMA